MKPLLIPEPKHLRHAQGYFPLKSCHRIFLAEEADTAALRAARELSALIREASGETCYLDRRHERASFRQPYIDLRLARRATAESYRLRVSMKRVIIEADGLPGLFYAIQTLKQLVLHGGSRLPCCSIDDAPALPNRGYYLDISRGKVPKMATIERLIDRLAGLKINQFQLYIEHVFHFKFDPDIGDGFGSLTPEDVLRLDAYCRERHIRFVPSLTCFGHMGRILSLPQYRKLAEVEWPSVSWQKAKWLQRLQGATINPLDKRAQKLLTTMLNEYLPLFSANQVNICADETYDLGRGKNAKLAKRRGIASLYTDHLKFLRGVAREHGKKLMFWGDVMLQHPADIKHIPSDATVLDWAYYPQNKFEKVGHFTKEGLAAYVCPSVRGYKTVFNDVEEARVTIQRYARTGLDLGASGLLNTDWGDMGHFNMLTCSLHGMAIGAAMSWKPEGNAGALADRAFSLQLGGNRDGKLGRLYKRLGSTGISSWPLFIQPHRDVEVKGSLLQAAKRSLPVLEEAYAWLSSSEAIPLLEQQELDELRMACRALQLNAEKIMTCSALSSDSKSAAKVARARLRRQAKDYADFATEYAPVWRAGNRIEGLDEVTKVLRKVSRHAARLAS